MSDSPTSVTRLLAIYRKGDAEVLGELMAAVYGHLRAVARNQMRRGPGTATLTPTGLVHEAFLVLSKSEGLKIENREHFFAIAARCMRWILMDRAKLRRGQKRGGGLELVPLDDRVHGAAEESWDLVALDEALTRLAAQDARLARVVELRFLTGLSLDETAAALKVSIATVKRDWNMARAWLSRELADPSRAA